MKHVATLWRVEWVDTNGVVHTQTARSCTDQERYVDQLLLATEQPFNDIVEIRSLPVLCYEKEGLTSVRYVRPPARKGAK